MTRAHTHRAVSPAALTQSGKFSQALPANAHEARSLLTAPIVYSLLLPFAVLDLWVTTYQRICFPVYGVPRVRRRDYLTVDRRKLSYLTGLEKANCVFCGYVNGVIAYVREVGARTSRTGARSSTGATFPIPAWALPPVLRLRRRPRLPSGAHAPSAPSAAGRRTAAPVRRPPRRSASASLAASRS